MQLPQSGVTARAISAYPVAMPPRKRRSVGEITSPPLPPKHPNQLRALRKRLGLTQERVATAMHMAYQTYGKYERGESEISYSQAQRFAAVLRCAPDDIFSEATLSRRVPVVGYVGAGEQVFPFDELPPGEGLRQVQCPVGLDPKKTVAVEVRGDSMRPIDDGWLVFYTRTAEGVPYEAVGQECVVKIAGDGPLLIKRVRPGYTRGRFNLLSRNADPIEDAALEWAAPVRAFLPPDLVS